MKNKGFTLIELLAVIVILAIIALIATPIILGIINDSKKQSSMRSAELYLKSAELAIARKNLTEELGNTECTVQQSGNLVCTGVTGEVQVDVDGTRPEAGSKITFTNGKITNLSSYKVENTKYKLENGSLKVDDGAGEEANSTTMYYSYDLSGTINVTAAPAEPSTEPPTGKNVYIGYNISEGKVSAAYICFKRNGEQYCLKGYDTNAFSDNTDVLRGAFSDIANTSACDLDDDDERNCELRDDGQFVGVTSSGVIEVDIGDDICVANVDGVGDIDDAFGCF